MSTPGPLGDTWDLEEIPSGVTRTSECSVDIIGASPLSRRVLVEMMVLLVLLDPL